jgi:hypothetical protein
MATNKKGRNQDHSKQETSAGNNNHKGGNGNSRQTVNLDTETNGAASESSPGGRGNSRQGNSGGSIRSGR